MIVKVADVPVSASTAADGHGGWSIQTSEEAVI